MRGCAKSCWGSSVNKAHFYRLFPLLLLIFIDSFSYFVVIPVLLQLFFHNHFGLLSPAVSKTTRDTLTGITISLSPMAALIAAPIIGNASDKHGRKKTLLGCIVAVIIGFALPIIGILMKNIYFVLAGRFIAGIGSASQSIAQAAVSDLCKNEEKALYFSFIALMMTLALIIAPLAGGYLSHWFNVTIPYFAALGLSIFNLFLLLFFFAETKNNKQQSNMFGLKKVIAGLASISKQYNIGLLVLLFFCLELGWSQYYQTISLFLHAQLHFNSEKISLFNASMGLTMSFGLLILYPILLRFFTIKHIMNVSVLQVAIGLIFCALFSDVKMQWIFSTLVAVSTGCGYVSLVALISNKTSESHQGLVLGYLSTILYLAWMATSFVSGYLFAIQPMLPLFVAPCFLIIGYLTHSIRAAF